MKLLPITEVKVAPRQRQEFDAQALQDLVDSIEANGLLHAPVLRDGGWLVAGERRLRAIKEIYALGGTFRYDGAVIPVGSVPYVDLGELDDLARMEAELSENIHRADLTWQERAAAEAKLHLLRAKQKERAGLPPQTAAETAEELHGRSDGGYQAGVRTNIILAQHLHDPDVSAAKNPKDAMKILLRKEEQETNTARALTVGRSYSAASHTLVHGDSLQWMQTSDAAQFDVIVTDPPYGMGADDFGDAAGKLITINHEYKDDATSFYDLLGAAAPGFDRICKPAAHLYVFCDIDNFHFLRGLFAKSWKVFRTPIVLHKLNSGRVPLPEFGPRRCYELILYAYRGGRRTTSIYPDVITATGDDNLGHGAQKPVGVYQDLLKRSCRPGDRVCDPFAGTGTIFPAAHALQLYATGVEKEANYYGIALKRLQELDNAKAA